MHKTVLHIGKTVNLVFPAKCPVAIFKNASLKWYCHYRRLFRSATKLESFWSSWKIFFYVAVFYNLATSVLAGLFHRCCLAAHVLILSCHKMALRLPRYLGNVLSTNNLRQVQFIGAASQGQMLHTIWNITESYAKLGFSECVLKLIIYVSIIVKLSREW
jgi:hypothetical protein